VRNAYFVRLEKGLTAIEAAEQAGVSLGALRSLERGDREPSAPVVARLCSLYGLGARDLLSDEAEQKAA
jgi:transcriptional regulator with XRE-family HTH domain